VIPTAASTTSSHASTQGKTTHASIGKDSGDFTADLGPIGEGCFILIYVSTLFIFTLALCTPPLRPIPDDGNKIYFDLTSYLKKFIDVEMHSPVSLQGSSRTIGGILRGNAYGNNLNHADFEQKDDLGPHMLIKPKLTFKIFVYVQYGDVLVINRVPDFDSQFPITVFFLNETSLLAKPLLEKASQFHDSISRKPCYY